jgi:hypothetical protein
MEVEVAGDHAQEPSSSRGAGILKLRDNDLSWTPSHGGDIVALDHRTAMYLSANRSAAVLWTLVAAGSTEAQLAAALTVEFGIDETTAVADAREFVGDLDKRGLLLEGP